MARAVRSVGTPQIKQVITLEQDPNDKPLPLNIDDDGPSFWEDLAAISEDEWSRGPFVYLQRLYPKANTKGPAYVEKLTHFFDVDWVRQKYGGYDWRAMLCDANSKVRRTCLFSIDAPPKGAEPAAVAAGAVSMSNGGDGFQAQVLNLIRENNQQTQQLMERVIDRIERNSSSGTSSQEIALKGVVDVFTKLTPQGKDPLELLGNLKSLMPAQPDMLDLLTKAKALFGAATTGEVDLLGQLDKIVAVAEKLGFSGASKGPSVAMVLAEKAPQILEHASGMMDKWLAAAERNRQAQVLRYNAALAGARQANPPVIPGRAQPAATPPGATHAPAVPVSGLDIAPLEGMIDTQGNFVPMSVEPPAVAAGAAMPLDVLEVIKERIVSAIDKGMEGGMILDFIEVMDDNLIATFDGATEEQLTQFFGIDPILRQATTKPRFKRTIREIVASLNGNDVPADELVN